MNHPKQYLLKLFPSVKEIASCSELAHMVLLFSLFPFCSVLFSSSAIYFLPMWCILASHQTTEYLVAFFGGRKS